MEEGSPSKSEIKPPAGQWMLAAAIIASLVYNSKFLFLRDFNPYGLDFRVFWQVARTSLDTLYRTSDSPFVYPPTAIIFFRSLLPLGFISAYFLWTTASVAAFALAATSLTNVRVAALSMLSAAALQGLALGQTSMLLGAAILWAVTLTPLLCGAVLGIVLSIKPQLVFLAPLIFLGRRDWSVLLGMFVAVALSVSVELLLFGSRLWSEWIGSFPDFKEVLIRIGAIEEVISPIGAAEAAGLAIIPIIVASWFIAVALALGAAKSDDKLLLAATIVTASLLASPYGLRHDTIVLVPACILHMMRRPSIWALPTMGIFAGLLVPWALIFGAVAIILARPNFGQIRLPK